MQLQHFVRHNLWHFNWMLCQGHCRQIDGSIEGEGQTIGGEQKAGKFGGRILKIFG
jgi:hypothetical protein